MMSRPQVLNGFHHYGQPPFDELLHQQHAQAQAHTHAHAHPGPMYRPHPVPSLSMRAPEHPAAGYNHQHTGHHGRTSTVPMSDPAYLAADDELAQLQKLSSEYEPETTGPLVGERQSSSAIATEYANADPVYRVKTAALPSKYAYFRTCRGDGHCGWRAIAFTYYEAMLRAGDVHKFEDEEARLTSMHNLLNHVGFSEDIYEDFVEEAFGLLQKLANSMGAMDGAAADILLQTFNDYGTAMAIITYFKLLASAWIQSNPNDYQPFLLDYPDLKTYCQHNIEASNCEIDHVAMNALTEAIVKPAGFGLEVLYLDRSAGAEINTHRVDPTSPEGYPLANAPTMRLLYRPGHYDILYKAEDFPPPVASQGPIHVALAGYSDGFVPNSIHPSGINDVMAFIPGMSYPTGLGQRWPPVSYDYTPNPAPQPQVAPVSAYTPTPTPAAPVASSHQEYVAPVHASHVNHHPPASHHTLHLEPPITLPIHPPPAPPPLSIERGPPVNVERGGPFRPSMYEFEPGFGAGQVHSLPFQTSIFRNSHYNTAHFLNPDFQPEEWSPDSEYSAGNRGRHKSASQ